MRMLTYGAPTDSQDDHLRMSESRAVVEKFRANYLRGPNETNIARTVAQTRREDFLRCLEASIYAQVVKELYVCLAMFVQRASLIIQCCT
jgi:hypothetical protein